MTSRTFSSYCESPFTLFPFCQSRSSSQSALLKYWSFEPATNAQGNDNVEKQDKPKTDSSLKDQRSVDVTSGPHSDTTVPALHDALQKSSATKSSDVTDKTQTSLELPPKKLVPVIFFDEAHRLPLLIRDKKAMKCILDAMLVLTKQVRRLHFNSPWKCLTAECHRIA